MNLSVVELVDDRRSQSKDLPARIIHHLYKNGCPVFVCGAMSSTACAENTSERQYPHRWML